MIFAVRWKFIGHGRFIPKYFRGTKLHGNGRDRIAPILGRILLYVHFSMLLLCGFMMVIALSLFAIDLHTALRMI